MRGLLLGLATAGSMLTVTPVAAQDWQSYESGWNTYANGRFGYELCYPDGLVKPQPEAENGDGRVFEGRNGAEMRVWGSNNTLEKTLEAALEESPSTWVEHNDSGGTPRVNYSRQFSSYYVVSGNNETHDFFEKSYLKDGQFMTVRITFPVDDARRWQPVVARVLRCFKPVK